MSGGSRGAHSACCSLGLALRQLARAFADAHAAPVEWHVHPLPVIGSILLTWTMYALLVAAWRGLVTGWGQSLDYAVAARIWIVSSLGKYVPGKVWAIAGMAMMAKRAGVTAWAATGAAILNQALAVAAGAVVVGAHGHVAP